MTEPRACGTCSLCCKVFRVNEIEKPKDVWCPHCKPGNGCSIYETRPPTCRSFSCVWLQGPAMPEWMKPNKSRVVVSSPNGTALTVHPDPGMINAWREPAVLDYLIGVAKKGTVIVVEHGDRNYQITANGPVELKRTMTGPHTYNVTLRAMPGPAQ